MKYVYDSTNAGGERRVFALHPRSMPVGDERHCAGVCGFGAGPEIIPRADWPKQVDLGDEVTEILDQKQFSLCHSFGSTQANEVAQRLAGRKGVLLSAGNLAGQVTGYRDDGASIQDVFAMLTKKGQVARSLIGQYDYQGRDWPKGWETEAAKYRAIAWDCGQDKTTIDALVSGLIRRDPGVLGTAAFGGGHAVSVLGYTLDSKGKLTLTGANSWGPTWTNCGRPGWWAYSESQLRDVSSFGAYVIQSAVDNVDDPPPEIVT